LDGTTFKAITSRNTDSTFDPISDNSGYIGYSSALLSSNELYPAGGGVAVTQWAVTGKDGVVHPIPASSTQYLNQTWQTGNTHISGGIFVTGTKTMFASVWSAVGVTRYDRVDLTSGRVTTLFTVRFTSPVVASTPELFAPENITPSGNEISFLVANVTLGNLRVRGLAVVTYDVAAGSFSVHQLASSIAKAVLPPPTVSAFALTAFVSPDGGLLVYQTASVVDGGQVLLTHVYHVATGQDVLIPASLGVGFDGGSNSVFFSPDNSYAAMAGDSRLVVAATATGTIIKTVDEPDAGGPSIVPLGWTSTGAFVYALNPSGLETAYSFDPATGTDFEFPADLGELMAVLY